MSHPPDALVPDPLIPDALVLVDEDDRELGVASRAACHAPGGQRHRAFSVYLFDDEGRLLLQRRAATKPLWPGYWSNSCCSHPRPGEPVGVAATRRVREELGVEAALTWRFRYEYCADFGAVGTEHEVVHVFVGSVDPATVQADPREVEAWRMVELDELEDELAHDNDFTPWFRLAWSTLRADGGT